jgi:predicted nucleic acid-binding Zn finger protein
MKQIVSKQLTKENKKDRKEGKGHVLAISRKIYKLSGKFTYYVESETCDDRYYFVRFNPSVFEWCSCKDFENIKTKRCKHLYGIQFAIRFNTVLEVEHFPEEVRRTTNQQQRQEETKDNKLSYEDDIYSF